MAVDSIRSHKLRSFLTILGIVIGVMTVIGMVSIIQGLNKSFLSELQSAGSDIISVQKYEAVQMGAKGSEEGTDPQGPDLRRRHGHREKAPPALRQRPWRSAPTSVSSTEIEVKYQSAKSDKRHGHRHERQVARGHVGCTPAHGAGPVHHRGGDGPQGPRPASSARSSPDVLFPMTTSDRQGDPGSVPRPSPSSGVLTKRGPDVRPEAATTSSASPSPP